jgi:mRNA interferase RelE/StbE
VTGPVYKVDYIDRAQRELRRIARGDAQAARRIARAVDALGADPRPAGCRPLVGQDGLWRIRAGDYRAIYTIDDDLLVVLAVRVAHRGTAYDHLDNL